MIDELWNYECRITNAKLCLAHFDIRNSAFETSPRPYQVSAVKHMVTCINDDNGNGTIWHTTGSGNTLTKRRGPESGNQASAARSLQRKAKYTKISETSTKLAGAVHSL